MAESVAAPQLSPRRSPGQPLRNSTSSSLANVQTIAQARAELEGRLTNIHSDLQLTQTIGLLFVKRQEDLKNCFEQLQLLDDQEKQATADQGEGLDAAASERGDDAAAAASKPLPESFREQLVALDRDFQEGQDGIVGLKNLIDAQLPVTTSNSANDLSTSRSGSIIAPSALPSSALPAQTISKPRRHKVNMNSAPSTNDAAFPLQIQEELLNQVRYWTTQAELKEKLNQEYDLKINEQERIIDALHKQRRLREESEERQKEDQWNLELQNQELRNQNVDLQAQLSKATHENAKVQKAFATATEQVEQLKDKEEKTSGQLEITKSRHEQDMATMRKHMAGIQREKSDLLTKVEDLNATMTQQQRKLAKRATLDAIALAQEVEEKAAEPAVEAPVLIQAPARTVSSEEVVVPAIVAPAVVEPKVASLARETSFAHQQSIISELQSKLSKEITEKEELITEKEELLVEKEELVKMLADREETIETMRLEGVAVFEPTPLNEKSSLGLQGHGSHNGSDTDVLDDLDGYDHRDLSMSLSESGSRDFSNGRGSPFPTGGLFAELAQATSTTNIKAAAEYKDQEVMTEPIESWIHTIPGFVPPTNGVTPSPPADSLDKDAVEGNDTVDAEKTVEDKEVVDAAKTVEDKEAAEAHKGDQAKDSDNMNTVAEAKDDVSEAVITGKPGTETKHIPTDIVPTVPTADIPAVAAAATAADIPAVAAAATAVDIPAVAAAATAADIPAVAAAAAAVIPAVVAATVEPAQDEAVSPSPASTETVPAPTTAESADDTLTNDVQYTPSPAAHSKEGDVEPTADKSDHHSSKSSVEEERRHTCDMSQTISEPADVESLPPVPAVPADLAEPAMDKPSLNPEDRESRVSFGSAFGGDQNATDTGRIKSIYQDNASSPVASLEQSQDHANGEEKHSKLEAAAPLAVAAAVAAVTTAAAAANSSTDQNNVSSAEESTPKPAHFAATDKEVALPSVTAQTEQPSTAAGEVPLGRPSTTVVEVSSHTTYTYAAPSTSQVNLTPLNNGVGSITHVITDSSGVTIGRHPDHRPSPNGSISSMSTDYNQDGYLRNGRRMSNSSNFDLTPTDPTMIQLITQTMIGDYLWKYTRRRITTMMNEKMHWRYVWIHPYTKTMHWSLKNPGSGGSTLQSGKSGLIVAVTQITEEVPNSDLPAVSLMIQTSSRNIKLKAPTREKHDLWFRSISYLLSRPSSPGADSPGDNQTWSEVQANHRPSTSRSTPSLPTNDAVMTLRQSEMGGSTLRKKSSLARIQGAFRRSSTSRDVSSSTSPNSTSAVGSPRIGPLGAPLGLISTSTSTASAANAAEKRASVTNLATAYPITQGGVNGKHGVGNASTVGVGGNGTVNGGSILAQAEREIA
ncbi:hypothetical protein EC957_007924 [Mortierella hygrophila]|uniref:Pleckstrin homology domain-containing protein n=1 Tax=Mortierella hygrophila TaxID=979708 RepID=A0A9P6FDA9_9FUNG|nr:hypothetical protein EC957_007924 [Mortierella hygrophila]